MLVGVLASSATPLVISLADGSNNPFLFNFIWKAGGSVGLLGFLVFRYRTILLDHDFRARLVGIISWPILIIIMVGESDILIFSWALRYIDVSVATILYQTWPALLILSMLFLFRSTTRYSSTTMALVVPVILAIVGFILVTVSQVSDTGLTESRSAALQTLGLCLALVSALAVSAEVAATVRFGSRIRSGSDMGTRYAPDDVELFGTIAVTLVGKTILLPFFGLAAASAGEAVDAQTMLVVLIASIVISTAAGVLLRKSNLMTSNLGINVLGYVTPVLALILLFIFSQVGAIRTDYLIMGSAAIIAANILINFQAEIRFGFRSLILALWACGTFVYFRGQLADHFELSDWLWPPGEYFTAVGLAATVFTLILSFRVARLVTRTSDETNRTFALFSRIDLLASREVIAGDIRNYILRIGAHENAADLADAYHSARLSIRRAYQETEGDADRRELAEAAAEVDALAHSRQEGQDFGEYVALVVFAVITVALILLSLDAGASGWNGFLTPDPPKKSA